MAKRSVQSVSDTQTEADPQVTSPVTAEPAEPVTKIVTSETVEDAGAIMGEPVMPAVQDHALDAARAEAAPPTPTASGTPIKGKTDDIGRPFDPLIHEAGPDGTGRLNRDGYLAKRRGGAKGRPGATPLRSKVDTTPRPGAAAAPPPPDMEAAIQGAAEQSTGLFLGGAMLIGGEEFAPADKGEQDAVVIAFANYYRAKGIPDIPPGVALALGLGMYCAKRWNMPKFKEKRQGWWFTVKRWWNDYRFRKSEARRSDTTRVHFEAAADHSPAG